MNRPLDKDMIIDLKERIIEAIKNNNTGVAEYFVELLADVNLVLYDISLKETMSGLQDALGDYPGIIDLAKRDISDKVSEAFKEKEK